MTNRKFNISFATLALVMLMVAGTVIDSAAQQLPKRGSIIEQIEASKNKQRTIVDELLDYAFTFRGVPYRYGQMSPRGFDCSGFTSYVFKRFGYDLTRTSRGQINDGQRVSRDELKPGDLVFFTGRAIGPHIGHVGIVTQVNDDSTFNFIHASCSRGITESRSDESYYVRRYRGACRVISKDDETTD